MAVELIYHLYEKKFVEHNIEQAKSGSFVEVTGDCFFGDLNAMKLARYMAEQNKHTQNWFLKVFLMILKESVSSTSRKC